ncbi:MULTISPECIES: thiamine pyrophosphate-dependent dehydrogenase E1 component subunit alpha [unclassified Rhodococcus (in: high G+C Gram-positive bacteria)]|uniref:thiamine pyrophosphate-dependent dehydrogenase E1 component subunit alpha n=1 Tax=unclassified Rhodococcus (in: high G+C Gram-positive bacteria) TaxID=192944 RepID=UPI000926FDCA|nr:thiamine pyrophosphate-dependent dehydrogenase E1 component subunit alpha [Rhodococcus sp. M8]OLL18991.1 ABC transporter substrate-binding protein [Rhodococcus sp. M8]QPG47683.1 thiamine pyrophosphate-dependent dehydrogenase E1 component subunit alpha [Rhodococcus sp. M8]
MALNKSALLSAYRKMSEIREFEDRLHEENATGDIPGFIHLYSGQEAIAVGVCENLNDTDYIGSTHRGHGHCIAKGCDLDGMMAEIFGKNDGLCHGKGGSMHIADLSVGMLGANAIVGGAPSLAIGAALSAKTLGNGGVAASFTGDGGSNQGTVFEAMNMAVVLELPIVFVIENNGFGEATGRDYAVGTPSIAGRAASFGMPATTVDGTDFFEVHEAAREAVERARRGGGPSTIEAVAHRWHGHFEGDAQLYRTAAQVAELRRTQDPLVKFRAKVDGKKVTAKELDAIDAEARERVDVAVTKARAAEYPPLTNLLTDVYVSY